MSTGKTTADKLLSFILCLALLAGAALSGCADMRERNKATGDPTVQATRTQTDAPGVQTVSPNRARRIVKVEVGTLPESSGLSFRLTQREDVDWFVGVLDSLTLTEVPADINPDKYGGSTYVIRLTDSSAAVDELYLSGGMWLRTGGAWREIAEDDRAKVAELMNERAGVLQLESGLPVVMPADFAIRYETWIDGREIYDTYEGYVQKSTLDGEKRTALKAENIPLEDIYEVLRQSRLESITREMTSEVLAETDERVMCNPLSHYEITFTANGRQYSVKGDFTASSYRSTDTEASDFMDFVSFMDGILYDCEEYKSIPGETPMYA